MISSKNLINGKPLEFGNREQIQLMRKANDVYTGLKPADKVKDHYDIVPPEWGSDDDEPIEEFSHQYVNFFCIHNQCHSLIAESASPSHNCGYFWEGHIIQCWDCEAEYEIKGNEVFHVPAPHTGTENFV